MKILTRKNIIVFSIVAVLLIVYLIIANSIMLRLFSSSPPLRVVSHEDLTRNTTALSHVRWDMRNDLFDSFFIHGWAFAEAGYQENKTVDLVLRGINSGRFYSAPFVVYRNAVTTRGLANAGLRIEGEMHNVAGEFSSLTLPTDVYEVYLHIQENANEAGWARTGIKFEVNSKGLAAFNPQSHSFTDVPIYDGWIHGNVESSEIVDNVLNISGWFVRYGFDSLFQTIWIELTDDDGDIATFLAPSVIRDDIVNHFHEPLYRYSGYDAEIPLDVLGDWESLTLVFIIENNGVFYRYELPQ